MDTKTRYEELKSTIQRLSYEYYVLDNPSGTDYEYDMLMRELLSIEEKNPSFVTPDSPSQKIAILYFVKQISGVPGSFL